MAKKTKKDRKRDARDERERDEAAAQVEDERVAKRQRTFRIAAMVVPVVTLAISLSIYFTLDDRQLAALIGMVGLAIWVPVLLGVVGGGVQPRDRTRAGSIDFGNRR